MTTYKSHAKIMKIPTELNRREFRSSHQRTKRWARSYPLQDNTHPRWESGIWLNISSERRKKTAIWESRQEMDSRRKSERARQLYHRGNEIHVNYHIVSTSNAWGFHEIREVHQTSTWKTALHWFIWVTHYLTKKGLCLRLHGTHGTQEKQDSIRQGEFVAKIDGKIPIPIQVSRTHVSLPCTKKSTDFITLTPGRS